MLKHDLVEHNISHDRGHVIALFRHAGHEWARVRWLADNDLPEVDGDVPVSMIHVVEVRADARVAG